MRLSDEVIILGNGGVKDVKTYEQSARLNGYVMDLQKFDALLKKEWFDNKLKAVPSDISEEVKLSAEVISRLDYILKAKGITQRELAKRMGRSEAVISRWTSGFPNLTLKTISELSAAVGEPLIVVPS